MKVWYILVFAPLVVFGAWMSSPLSSENHVYSARQKDDRTMGMYLHHEVINPVTQCDTSKFLDPRIFGKCPSGVTIEPHLYNASKGEWHNSYLVFKVVCKTQDTICEFKINADQDKILMRSMDEYQFTDRDIWLKRHFPDCY